MNLLFFLLQIPNADTTGASEASTQETTYFDLALQGGWVMVPILILSVVAIYIFIERYFAIKGASKVDENFMNRIRDYIHDDKIDSALALCQSYQNPVARMIEKGISRIGRSLQDVNAAIENVGKLEIYNLEKGLPTLATVAGGAPMIGFLGTVLGMIRALIDITAAGENFNITTLSAGIYQAMVTTVAGLIVGIIAYFCYNYLVARVEKVVNMLEGNATEFMDLLNEPVR
ncbi:MAG: MotA/TolQ/ExbB proton channel family protein [Bacteroidota bacterium]